MSPAVETAPEDTRAVFDTNFFGAVRVTDALVVLLRQARGTVCNIGSIAALVPAPWVAMYSASKAALKAYTHTLRVELAPLGVNVVYVETSSVKTNTMSQNAARHLKEDSLYASLNDLFEQKQEETGGQDGIEAADYAKQVAGSLLRPSGWRVWAGENVTLVRVLNWLHNLLPGDLWGFIVTKSSGFATVKL